MSDRRPQRVRRTPRLIRVDRDVDETIRTLVGEGQVSDFYRQAAREKLERIQAGEDSRFKPVALGKVA